MFSAQKAPEMLIITAIHSKSCVYKQGDHLNFMSVVNKQVCLVNQLSVSCLGVPDARGCSYSVSSIPSHLIFLLGPPSLSHGFRLAWSWLTSMAAQDYARLHNYKVIAATNVADPTLDNMWNKVGWLLKAYHVSNP